MTAFLALETLTAVFSAILDNPIGSAVRTLWALNL